MEALIILLEKKFFWNTIEIYCSFKGLIVRSSLVKRKNYYVKISSWDFNKIYGFGPSSPRILDLFL